MNSTVKKYSSNSPTLKTNRDWLNSDSKPTYTSNKTLDLIIGLAIAALAFPLITLTIMLGTFFSQEKWEEFWDTFL